jgi:hypothetical protein
MHSSTSHFISDKSGTLSSGVRQGLKIKNKSNQVLFDSAWTAGVEYEKANTNRGKKDINDNDRDPKTGDANNDKDNMDVNNIANILRT